MIESPDCGNPQEPKKSEPESVRILFWNVNNRNLTHLVCEVVDSRDVDVVVLNEISGTDSGALLTFLRNVDPNFYKPSSSEERFYSFCRKRGLDMQELNDGFRFSVRRLSFGPNPILLAIIHGVDVRNHDAESRQSIAEEFADELRHIKSLHDTDRVIVLGDFNMNPFDRVMNLARGLNAMMTIAITKKRVRRFANKDYDLYYNPMWGLFGDNTNGPPGTIYDTSSIGHYGWSMFDQAVLSHSVIGMFKDVEILDHTGRSKLTTSEGLPDKTNASDHLPILLTLQRGTK